LNAAVWSIPDPTTSGLEGVRDNEGPRWLPGLAAGRDGTPTRFEVLAAGTGGARAGGKTPAFFYFFPPKHPEGIHAEQACRTKLRDPSSMCQPGHDQFANLRRRGAELGIRGNGLLTWPARALRSATFRPTW